MKRYIKKIFNFSVQKLSGLNQKECELITKIRDQKLTYLNNRKLISITNTCKAIETEGIPGVFIEAGCALGGSSILIASLKRTDRPLNIYDVFGMIPPPTEKDTNDVHERYKVIADGKSNGIGGDKYYGYENDLFNIVLSNLESFSIDCEKQSVTLIKGLLQDTMQINERIAFAHIDVDWYEPVMLCLERIFPNLSVGGSIILDDYHDWGGCRKATDEYLKNVAGQFILDDSFGSMKITKI